MEDNIVRIFPLSDIDSFSASKISIEELKIIYKEGFILTEIQDNMYFFVKNPDPHTNLTQKVFLKNERANNPYYQKYGFDF